MNKSIDSIAILFVFSLLPLSVNSQNPTRPEPKWTIEQVREMAKKYNLQDSISYTNRYFLIYVDKIKVEKYLQEESTAIRETKEMKEYLEKTKFVRTLDDDIRLLNSYPSVKAAIVKMRGGEAGHRRYVQQARKYQWRIYRNNQGGLAFERADLPITESEKKFGQRIDNLPPQKE